jgi:hypothetical protein
MGNRGQVKIISEGNPDLYLYTHWGADVLPNVVADALRRGSGRWDDEEYLNRIIFSEMIQYNVLEETGFGIGFAEHGDVWRIVEVNYDNRTAAVRNINYDSVDFNNDDWDNMIAWEHECDHVSYGMFIAQYATLPVSKE